MLSAVKDQRAGTRDLPRSVLLASRNRHKLREIRDLLSSLPLEILSLRDVGLSPMQEEDGVEVFDTFEENAFAKARYYRRITGLATVADDSGLCVDALGGAPGVRSRRFATDDVPSGDAQDAANNRHLLRLLEGIPSNRRGAHYRCAAALVTASLSVVAVGRVHGAIALAERGSGGFGYDPLFLLSDVGLTYGELPEAVKAETSHRAAAFRSLRRWLSAPRGRE